MGRVKLSINIMRVFCATREISAISEISENTSDINP